MKSLKLRLGILVLLSLFAILSAKAVTIQKNGWDNPVIDTASKWAKENQKSNTLHQIRKPFGKPNNPHGTQ